MKTAGIIHTHSHHHADNTTNATLTHHGSSTTSVADEEVSPSYNTENTSGKRHEIENIRKALHLSQEKTLWEVLDAGRHGPHVVARQNAFLQGLASGGVCQSQFMKYLVNLLPIHTALEEAQKELSEIDYIKGFIFPELYRSEALKQDLIIWEHVAAKRICALEATQDYIRVR